ncbi:MAG: 50S ribosomal protein L15 [Ignavibacteriae bacterium]|nr:50S ribosomal protein L15 [Ignavibacteria bacterium]MBI3364467.1 50S ribosomal protein L15 [Ignavibacteriota bacterium]
MANLHNLHYAEGSRKRVKRIGRGQGSGHGGTSTRGHKGEGARSGTHYRPWFEGGQMPLIRRVPKFGFHSPFRTEYQVVNVAAIEKLVAGGKLKDGKITPDVLYMAGAVSKKSAPIKILGEGDMKTKLEVSAHAFSKSAVEKIEGAGGKAITISLAKS